ncbi:RidA family protein [Fusibacter sp. Q10-2]|uniref:RidA family protein n=1 Tax=Fusibacter ferrireducens TaxID=2785058 RepID=A0ABR9ZP66_9FIRM|nr:RidA family protein [Fusibacter ferrireducens]
MKNVVETQNAPKAIGPYSQAITVDDYIFTSGQLPINPSTGEVLTGIKAQTRMALKNLTGILNEVGAELSDVVKTTVYLSEMKHFEAMNEVYKEFFTENFPARSAFEVAALPLGADVEIEAIARKKSTLGFKESHANIKGYTNINPTLNFE